MELTALPGKPTASLENGTVGHCTIRRGLAPRIVSPYIAPSNNVSVPLVSSMSTANGLLAGWEKIWRSASITGGFSITGACAESRWPPSEGFAAFLSSAEPYARQTLLSPCPFSLPRRSLPRSDCISNPTILRWSASGDRVISSR